MTEPPNRRICTSSLSPEILYTIVAEHWGVPVSELPQNLKVLLTDRALGNPMAAVSLAMALKEEEQETELKSPTLIKAKSSLMHVGEVSIPPNIFRLVTRAYDRCVETWSEQT